MRQHCGTWVIIGMILMNHASDQQTAERYCKKVNSLFQGQSDAREAEAHDRMNGVRD